MTKQSVDLHSSSPASHGATEGGCQCEHDDSIPELDVRTIPHTIRHATVFGALSAIQPGFAMDLVAPHNPLPLLAQIEQMFHGDFSVDYLESGPEDWKLRFTRA